MPSFGEMFGQSFNRGISQGLQVAEVQRRREHEDRIAQMQDWQTLQNVLTSPPGPTKDVVVGLLKKNWEARGQPLPDEVWGALKKGDEAFAAQVQVMADDLAKSGVTLTPQSLGMILSKHPEMLASLYKVGSERMKMAAEQQESQQVTGILSKFMGGPASQENTPAPSPQVMTSPPPEGVGMPQTPAFNVEPSRGLPGASASSSPLPAGTRGPVATPGSLADMDREISRKQALVNQLSIVARSERNNKLVDNLRSALQLDLAQRQHMIDKGYKDANLEIQRARLGEAQKNTALHAASVGIARQAEARHARESILTPEGLEAHRQIAAAQGIGRVEAELQKPLGKDADQFINVETLEPAPPKMTNREVQQSDQYVALPQRAQENIREKVASLKTYQEALQGARDIIERNPEIFPEGAQGGVEAFGELATAYLRSKTSAKLDPKVRQDLARLQGLNTARARFARAWGDVGNLTEQEQRIQSETIAPGANFKNNALARINQVEQLLVGPTNEYFRSQGLKYQFQPKGQRAKKAPVEVAPGITIEEVR